MPSRLLTFAGSSVTIEYEGADPARIVEFLYQYLPFNEPISSHVTFRLETTDNDKFYLYCDDELVCEDASMGVVAEVLVGQTCYHLADKSQGGVLFHAAGLAWEDKGILLPGPMATGKSTLTAWLLTQRFNYLSDELVFIPQGTDTMQAFPRPLNLKHPSRLALKDYVDYTVQTDRILSSSGIDLVPHTLFNPRSILSEPQLKLIIFPHYQANSDFELRLLSKAQAGKQLMQCCINARNLSGHGFSDITNLVRRVRAYHLTYSDFAQIGREIEELVAL